MDKINKVMDWLMRQDREALLFLSVHFKNPPETKGVLCWRCRSVFIALFRQLLGRHWIKIYRRHFTLIGFQEFGMQHRRHIHFLLWLNTGMDPSIIISTLKCLSSRIRMDIWSTESEKFAGAKQYGDDIMIVPVYSDAVFDYIVKEMRHNSREILNNSIVLDVDIIH